MKDSVITYQIEYLSELGWERYVYGSKEDMESAFDKYCENYPDRSFRLMRYEDIEETLRIRELDEPNVEDCRHNGL